MAKWKRLIELRKEKGYTQEEMAVKCGVSPSSYVRWELLQFQPNINQLKTLSYVLSVPIDYLVYNDSFTHADSDYWRKREEIEQKVNEFLAKYPAGKNAPTVASIMERLGNPDNVDPEYVNNPGSAEDPFPNSIIGQTRSEKGD